MDIIRKQFSVTHKALDALTFEATINTAAKDRVGDIVIPAGAKMENYLKNPVVPFAHDYNAPPVAKAISVTLQDSALVATFKFPAPGVYAFADTIRQLWADGFLNAVSIGFIPLKWIGADGQPGDANQNMWFFGGTVTEWELLEFSLVPVPANQEALRRGLHLPADYVKAVTRYTIETREGRVLSKKNRDLISTAITEMGNATEALQNLLDASDPAQDDNSDKAANDDHDTTDNDLPESLAAQMSDTFKSLEEMLQ